MSAVHHRDTERTEGAQRNRTTGKIIGAAIEVHRSLGPGLLESAYEECLCRELTIRRLPFVRQVPLRVDYKGIKLDCSYRLDLVVEGVVVEIKSVAALEPTTRHSS